jgi:hypothetical protein
VHTSFTSPRRSTRLSPAAVTVASTACIEPKRQRGAAAPTTLASGQSRAVTVIKSPPDTCRAKLERM